MSLAGWPTLARAVARDELHRVLPWTALLVLLSASSIVGFRIVFDDLATRVSLAATVASNPGMHLVLGVPHDLLTADGFNAWRAGNLGALLLAVMAVQVVVRCTRGEEDSGRAELLASGVLGRQAPVVVALLVAWAACVLAAVVAWTVTVLVGGGAGPTFWLCAGFAAVGVVFAGLGAVAAQVGSDARSSSALALTVVGLLNLARGYVDASDVGEWGEWTTPYGWVALARRDGAQDAWLGPATPWLLVAVSTVALAGLALVLHSRRDFGQGAWAPRPGAARAGWVGTLGGMQVRLLATTTVAWLVTFAVLGAVLGSLSTSLGSVVVDNPVVAQVLVAGGLDDVAGDVNLMVEFVRTLLKVLALVAAAAGTQVVMSLYAEEEAGRVDPLLATPVRRPRLLGWVALLAHATATAGLLLAATLLGVLAAHTQPDVHATDVVLQAAAMLPATWLLVGVGLAAVGVRPAVRMIGWAAVAATFAMTVLGPLFRLDREVLATSPLWHVPDVTGDGAGLEGGWTGWAVVLLLWLVALVVAFVGYRRRDLV